VHTIRAMSSSEPLRRAIATRTRRLYALAFAACGSSHRAVHRRIGRDVRSIVAATDVPTLGCIVDLSRALGMRPAAVVDLLVESGVRDDGAGRGATELESQILVADLIDDAMRLERLAERVPPSRTALRAAVLARALTARGSIDRAIAVIGSIRIDVVDACAGPLLATSIGEIAVLRPDASRDPACARAMHALLAEAIPAAPPSASGADEPLHLARPVRANFHRDACEIALARDASAAHGLLCRLADRLEIVRAQGTPLAAAWAASTTALVALALLERCPHEEASVGVSRAGAALVEPALRIAVRAGFALEDLTRCGDQRAERLACARRARTILVERSVRLARGEDPLELVDAADLAELRMAILRFPDADPRLRRFRDFETFLTASRFDA
jgi:hypothetical protein